VDGGSTFVCDASPCCVAADLPVLDPDGSVPFEFSVGLHEQIQAVGGVSENYLYEGDDHNLAGYFNSAMTRSVAFFDKYVKNAQ